MATVYSVGVRFHLTGNLDRELREALRGMRDIEREAARAQRTLDRINLRGPMAQVAALRRELAGLSGPASGRSLVGDVAKGLAGSVQEMRGLSRAAGTLESRVERITKGLNQWPEKIAAAARAMERMRAPDLHFSGSARGGGGRSGTPYDAVVHPSARRGRGEHIGREGSAFVGVLGVGAGVHTLQSIAMQGASSVREDLRAKNAGLTPDQTETLRRTAAEIAQKYPSISRLSAREQGRLLIPNVGDFKTAMGVLPEYIAGQVALQLTAGPEGGQKDMEAFARFVDIIGRSMSAEDTRKLIDSFVRFRQLDAEAIKSSDFVNAAQSAGTAGKSLSVGFWGTVAPALFSQQKGARTGTDLASAYQNTMIGRGTDSAIAAQAQSGWREGFASKVGKSGKVKVTNKGSLVDEALYGSDPFEWAKRHVIPDMVKRGLLPGGFARGDYSQDLTDAQRSGGAKYLSDRFSNRRGANIFSMMIQDIEQISKIIEQRNKARGTADVLSDQGKDVFSAVEGTKAQAAGAASALSAPSIPQISDNLARLNTGLSQLADYFEKNPDKAQAMFGGGAAVIGGGLAAGAAALTIAAVGSLSLPALAIGAGAAITIAALTIPFEKFFTADRSVVTPKSFNPLGVEATGAEGGPLMDAMAERHRRRAAAIQGLGVTAENTAEAQRRLAETTGHVRDAAVPAASVLDRLGDSLKSLLLKIGEGMREGSASPINFNGGGGLGGLVQKASFGGANDNSLGGIEAGTVARSVMRGGAGGGGGGGRGISARDLRDANPEMVAYIREAAIRNGIDPNVALSIANSEGLRGSIPGVRNTPGDKGTSFGPFQLHYKSRIPGLTLGGLGDRYTRETGHHASDPKHWKEQIDFSLRVARREGWGAWHGRKGAGIGLRDGIGVPPPPASAPTAGPPPRRNSVNVTAPVHLDGRVIARVVTKHMVADARFSRHVGGMDTHGSWRPPGTTLTDAA